MLDFIARRYSCTPAEIRQMPTSDIAAAFACASVEQEAEHIKFKKQKEQSEAEARRKRQLGH